MKKQYAVKKVVGLVLVLFMVFGLAVPVIAANEPPISVRMVVEGLEFDLVGSQPSLHAGRGSDNHPSNMSGFSEGLLAVRRNGRMGFIDKYGNQVIPITYHAVHTFSEGFSMVARDGRIGFVDRNGNVAVPLIYADALSFSEGMAMVRTGTFGASGRAGFIDRSGNVVIPLQYDFAYSFSNGRAVVENHPNIGVIDTTGRVVVPIEGHRHDVRHFSEGRMAVLRNDAQLNIPWILWGFVNTEGSMVVPLAIRSAVGNFSEGFAWVQEYVNGERSVSFVDMEGNRAISLPSEIGLAGDFSEGLAKVGVIVDSGQRFDPVERRSWWERPIHAWGFVNRAGEIVVPLEYSYVSDFRDGLARVEVDGRAGFIDRAGNVVIPLEYDSIDFRIRELESVYSRFPQTFPGFHPNYTLERFFPSIGHFNDGVAVMSRGGRWGAIDRTGREVVPFIYDFIYPFNEGLSAALHPNGTWSILEIVGFEGTSTVTPSQPTPPPTPTQHASVIIDGAPLQMDVPAQVIGGRTMVPMRAIFEALDAEVIWDGATQTATGTRDDTTVVLPIGSTSPTVNGSVVTIDAPGVVIDGRTLVPLRFVAESFGVDVNWDGNARTVTITS